MAVDRSLPIQTAGELFIIHIFIISSDSKLEAFKEQFKEIKWQEKPVPAFERPTLIETPLNIKHQNPDTKFRFFHHSSKFKPVAGSFSSDCSLMFLRDNTSIRIYKIEEIKAAASNKTDPLPFTLLSIIEGKIQYTFLERTVGAYVTEKRCFVFQLNQKVPDQQEICLHEEWQNATMKCVTVSESILSNNTRLVLVAIGLQSDSNEEGDNTGSIALYRVWPPNWSTYTRIWQSSEIHTVEDLGGGRIKRLTDSPKTLTFSRDGSLLVCTTKRYNQVHAWRLPSVDTVTNLFFGRIKKICSARIPFNDVSCSYFLPSTHNTRSRPLLPL